MKIRNAALIVTLLSFNMAFASEKEKAPAKPIPVQQPVQSQPKPKGTNILWGTNQPKGNNILWGTIKPKGNNILWGTRVVWGDEYDEEQYQ